MKPTPIELGLAAGFLALSMFAAVSILVAPQGHVISPCEVGP